MVSQIYLYVLFLTETPFCDLTGMYLITIKVDIKPEDICFNADFELFENDNRQSEISNKRKKYEKYLIKDKDKIFELSSYYPILRKWQQHVVTK